MFNPQEKLTLILKNYPEGPDAVYDLLLWANSAKGNILEQLEFDDLMDSLYGRTSDGHKHRKEHDRRVVRAQRRDAVEQASTNLPA